MRILLVLVLGLTLFSCVKNKNIQNSQVASQPVETPEGTQVAGHVVEVKEVVQASSYTYMLVSEHGVDKWIAVNKQDANVGDKYYYERALQMTNFTSKELDRTFDVIYFVSQLSDDPRMLEGGMAAAAPHSGSVQTDKKDLNLDMPEGVTTISDLFKNSVSFAGKKVKVHGVVVKVNKGIMGRNWIHIQDGTSYDGNFDLTITSQEEAEVDDTVTFEGTVSVNKDFGAGYFYNVILEDGTSGKPVI